MPGQSTREVLPGSPLRREGGLPQGVERRPSRFQRLHRLLRVELPRRCRWALINLPEDRSSASGLCVFTFPLSAFVLLFCFMEIDF